MEATGAKKEILTDISNRLIKDILKLTRSHLDCSEATIKEEKDLSFVSDYWDLIELNALVSAGSSFLATFLKRLSVHESKKHALTTLKSLTEHFKEIVESDETGKCSRDFVIKDGGSIDYRDS